LVRPHRVVSTRNHSSKKVPISTAGHSVSPAFSASSPSSSTISSLAALATAWACSPIIRMRSAGSSTTCAAASFFW
jgi:hypothetical protein